jgi:hypothetical protein
MSALDVLTVAYALGVFAALVLTGLGVIVQRWWFTALLGVAAFALTLAIPRMLVGLVGA